MTARERAIAFVASAIMCLPLAWVVVSGPAGSRARMFVLGAIGDEPGMARELDSAYGALPEPDGDPSGRKRVAVEAEVSMGRISMPVPARRAR